MDNFLYIIIGIVWVVYSLYTSKQKQQKKREMEAQLKGQPHSEPVHQKPRSIIEQLLDPDHEFSVPPAVPYDEYEDAVEPIPARNISVFPKNKSLEVIKDEVNEDYFENQYLSRGETNYYDTREKLAASQDVIPMMEDLVEDFDLRKAVIFSEILNPKYI